MDNKIKALAEYLEIEEDAIKLTKSGSYETDCNEYLVLTDEEADQEVKKEIKDSLWVLDAEFILNTCGLDSGSNVIESLRKTQKFSRKDCNNFIRAIVDGTCGIDKFVNQVILAYDRGYFLSAYNSEEEEQGGYFIYCIW